MLDMQIARFCRAQLKQAALIQVGDLMKIAARLNLNPTHTYSKWRVIERA